MTVPDVVMVVLRFLSTLINQMEGSSLIAVALFRGLAQGFSAQFCGFNMR